MLVSGFTPIMIILEMNSFEAKIRVKTNKKA